MRQKFGALARRTTRMDFVALFEQQLGEVRAVLPGDAGDERAFGHVLVGQYIAADLRLFKAELATGGVRITTIL